MLLKVGFVMMAFAVALTGVVVAILSTEEPARSAAVKSAEEPAKPLKRTDPMAEPEKEKAVEHIGAEEPESESEPEAKPESKPKPESGPRFEPEAEAEPAPDPEPRPEPELDPEPQPKPDAQPFVEKEPPEPTAEDIASAHEPRHYSLPDGAVLGLTVKSIGIHNVPVFDSVGSWSLKHGVGHHPETSMPWSNAPQRNVYVAGHRLGFPGTDSHLIFYRLGELGDGDEILLKARDGDKYRYRVTETFKASPNDSWVMGQVRNRDMVTLQTCTGPNWERRLIVRADRE